MSNHIAAVLPPVWRIFTESVEYYVRSVVNSLELHEDPVDEDGTLVNSLNLTINISFSLKLYLICSFSINHINNKTLQD